MEVERREARDPRHLLQGQRPIEVPGHVVDGPVDPRDRVLDGPAHFMVIDPDGNPILVDQHV